MVKRRKLGIALVLIGVIGVIAGVIPLVTTGLRIVVNDDLWNVVDLSAHGVKAMGLSVEWGMLSSAMGTCLGIFLLWAGIAWIKGRPEARAVTWCYVICGMLVNLTDMTIFFYRAKPGAMRSHMLVLDGIALAIPVVLGVWLIANRRIEQLPQGNSGAGRGTSGLPLGLTTIENT